MLRWQGLPEALDPRARQLVVQMRRLKDHSGLSLAALSAKTAYSKSSWERYLNGKTLPPREAVEELARVTGTEPTRLLALYEVASDVESLTPAPPPTQAAAPAPEPEPEPEAVPEAETAVVRLAPAAPERRGLRWLLAGVAAGLVLGATGLVAAQPWKSEAATNPGPSPSESRSRNPLESAHESAFPKHPKGDTYRCEVREHDGRTYAGHSATRRKVIEINSVGWEVVEAQCLLREAGFPPGAVDGIYGENTVNAVKRAQKKAGIADDGSVGPDTWKVLRK
ncbi:peptidoglycan-binding protein [Streptomyces sp. NPDC048172]|uniref:peptidoglycan-binding protein n=1 Tax=Streptomyces sp. NPDC048172 TaxID=3365505 RepID=UPI003719C378